MRKVSELLKDQPRLVKEFSEFYQNGVNGGRETLNPNVNNNVDVGRPMKPTDSSDTLMSGDGPITQARIISEQSQAVAPTPEVVEVVVNDEVVVSETTPLLGSDLESQMQVTASNTKFYAMVGGFTTFVLVGSSLSYALMNGYITALPW